MPLYSSYRGPTEVSYLFIDGGYLRGVVESFAQNCFDSSQVPLDYAQFAAGFTKVFYYDCLAPRRPQENEEHYAARMATQNAQFRTLHSLRGWHVVEGVVKRSGKRARQKEIDILIAVDMLTHTYRRNMHRVAFVAGDQDFRPLVEAVVREGMFIELWYERSSASAELIAAADAHRSLDAYAMYNVLDRRYQKHHPFPERSGQPGKSIDGATLIASGMHPELGNVELYQNNNGFMIVQPDDTNEGYFLHMRHENVRYLQRIHALTYGPCEWPRVV